MTINLEKYTQDLKISLAKKRGLPPTASVWLVMDASGSMDHFYDDGSVEDAIARTVVFAEQFDDDGRIEVVTYGDGCKYFGGISRCDLHGSAKRIWNASYDLHQGTLYAPPLRIVSDWMDGRQVPTTSVKTGFFSRDKVQPPGPYTKGMPVYILFITDGRNSDRGEAERIVREMSSKGAFICAIGLGNSEFPMLEALDTLSGRLLDNCSFFKLRNTRDLPGEELYDKMLSEYPSWAEKARNLGLVSY